MRVLKYYLTYLGQRMRRQIIKLTTISRNETSLLGQTHNNNTTSYIGPVTFVEDIF